MPVVDCGLALVFCNKYEDIYYIFFLITFLVSLQCNFKTSALHTKDLQFKTERKHKTLGGLRQKWHLV